MCLPRDKYKPNWEGLGWAPNVKVMLSGKVWATLVMVEMNAQYEGYIKWWEISLLISRVLAIQSKDRLPIKLCAHHVKGRLITFLC